MSFNCADPDNKAKLSKNCDEFTTIHWNIESIIS